MGRFLFCGFDLKTNNNDQRINDNWYRERWITR
jgi:hypothetical protein